MSIAASNPAHESHVEYEVKTREVLFSCTMEKAVEIVGPMKLFLWLETDVGYEADVHVCVRKEDGQGSALPGKIPPGIPWPDAIGRLRASHSKLDVELSTELVPVLAHDYPQVVMPDESMALDIAVSPLGIRFHAVEQLQILIARRSSDATHPSHEINQNIGKHIIRTGGGFLSYLLLPLVEL